MNAITMQENKSIKYYLRLVKKSVSLKQGHVNHFFFLQKAFLCKIVKCLVIVKKKENS